MAGEVPEWVEEYRRQVGQDPPGWSDRERRAEPWLRVGSGLVALLMAGAIIVILLFIGWLFLA